MDESETITSLREALEREQRRRQYAEQALAAREAQLLAAERDRDAFKQSANALRQVRHDKVERQRGEISRLTRDLNGGRCVALVERLAATWARAVRAEDALRRPRMRDEYHVPLGEVAALVRRTVALSRDVPSLVPAGHEPAVDREVARRLAEIESPRCKCGHDPCRPEMHAGWSP